MPVSRHSSLWDRGSAASAPGLGIITATPVLALLWPGTLDVAYGIGEPADPMLAALLQHRGAPASPDGHRPVPDLRAPHQAGLYLAVPPRDGDRLRV